MTTGQISYGAPLPETATLPHYQAHGYLDNLFYLDGGVGQVQESGRITRLRDVARGETYFEPVGGVGGYATRKTVNGHDVLDCAAPATGARGYEFGVGMFTGLTAFTVALVINRTSLTWNQTVFSICERDGDRQIFDLNYSDGRLHARYKLDVDDASFTSVDAHSPNSSWRGYLVEMDFPTGTISISNNAGAGIAATDTNTGSTAASCTWSRDTDQGYLLSGVRSGGDRRWEGEVDMLTLLPWITSGDDRDNLIARVSDRVSLLNGS